MPDLRFFDVRAPLSIEAAVAIAGARLVNNASAATEAEVSRLAALEDELLAGAAIYCSDKAGFERLQGNDYALCLTTDQLVDRFVDIGGAVAVAADPRLAFARLAAQFYTPKEEKERQRGPFHEAAIHETAVIADSAQIGVGAVIGAQSYIGPGVVIGDDANIESNVSITHAILAENVMILSGARIGQAGFGFVPAPEGLFRVPQLGRVIIEADAEIGANTTIDRGALGDTIIGAGAKIDNLVQIGHNVKIGRHCVIAAQTGISGSCVIGDGVFMGGQVGLSDHLNIGAGAQLAAKAGLMRDVPAGEKWGGMPARPVRDWLRETAVMTKLIKKKSGKE